VVASRSAGRLFFRAAGDAPFVYRVERGPRARFVGLRSSTPTRWAWATRCCASTAIATRGAGQVMPASFSRPRLTLWAVLAIIKGLRTSPDLTLQKLLMLGRIFG